MFAMGTASVDRTRAASIRTHRVSATFEPDEGVSDGVAEGVSVGVCDTGTSGGALGAFSCPGPLQPASSTTASPAAIKVRMMF
jgi:hypothetical protein